MKLDYAWDSSMLSIEETPTDRDIEFTIELASQQGVEAMKRVQTTFEENDVITDVFFYAFPDRAYKVVVRKDYYHDFILELMKHQLLSKVEWTTQ